MRSDRIKAVVSLVVIAGAAVALYFSFGWARPPFDARPHEALGQVLAEEAAKILGAGGHIAVIARDTTEVKNPAADAQMRGFQRALRQAKLTISSTNLFKLDPLRLVRVPAADFVKLMRKQSEADVIVSLLGPPILEDEQRAGLGETHPRIVALCSGAISEQVNLKQLFDQHLLHVAVVSKPDASSAANTARDLREAFTQFYEVVTPANLSELPRLTGHAAKN